MSFDNLYTSCDVKKDVETGIKDMPTKTITTHTSGENMAKKSRKPSTGLLAKANYKSKKVLGSVGRPVTVAAATGYGAYAAGQKFDVEFLDNPWTCAGIGVVTAGGVELTLNYFGDDTAIRALESARTVEELAGNKEWTGDIPSFAEELKAAGASESEVRDMTQTVRAIQARNFQASKQSEVQGNSSSNSSVDSANPNQGNEKHRKQQAAG